MAITCCDLVDDQPCNIQVLPGQPMSSAIDRAKTTGQIPRILRMPFQNLYPDGSTIASRSSRAGIQGSLRAFMNRQCADSSLYENLGFNGVACAPLDCGACGS